MRAMHGLVATYANNDDDSTRYISVSDFIIDQLKNPRPRLPQLAYERPQDQEEENLDRLILDSFLFIKNAASEVRHITYDLLPTREKAHAAGLFTEASTRLCAAVFSLIRPGEAWTAHAGIINESPFSRKHAWLLREDGLILDICGDDRGLHPIQMARPESRKSLRFVKNVTLKPLKEDTCLHQIVEKIAIDQQDMALDRLFKKFQGTEFVL